MEMQIFGAISAAFGLGVLSVLIYAITRDRDRIQLATLCLFFCAISYGFVAYTSSTRPEVPRFITFSLGAYSLFIYAAMSALAIYFHRWSYWAAVGIFSLHLLLSLLAPFVGPDLSAAKAVSILVALIVGGGGLWATLHQGSRQLIRLAPHAS
jgi:hypothetical protein